MNVNPFNEQQVLRFARVAARTTRRLPHDLKQEVFAAAFIKACETYESFEPERGDGSVESRLNFWFWGIARNAQKMVMRHELPLGNAAILDTLPGGDDPESIASRDEVIEALSPRDTAIVAALRGGDSIRQAAKACGVNVNHVKKLKRRMRTLLRNDGYTPAAARRAPAKNPDDVEHGELSAIDQALERMDATTRPRAHGTQDCSVCLLCSWYEGLSQGPEPHRCVEPEIAEAIRATHERKKQIAEGWQRVDVPHVDRRDVHRFEEDEATAAQAA